MEGAKGEEGKEGNASMTRSVDVGREKTHLDDDQKLSAPPVDTGKRRAVVGGHGSAFARWRETGEDENSRPLPCPCTRYDR